MEHSICISLQGRSERMQSLTSRSCKNNETDCTESKHKKQATHFQESKVDTHGFNFFFLSVISRSVFFNFGKFTHKHYKNFITILFYFSGTQLQKQGCFCSFKIAKFRRFACFVCKIIIVRFDIWNWRLLVCGVGDLWRTWWIPNWF